MRCLAALLLVGCIGAPDYYELSPYYGTLDLGTRDIDAEDMGLMFTMGWAPGETAHRERMEEWTVMGLQNQGVPLALIQDAMEDDEGEIAEDLELSDFTEKPETLDDAAILLVWAAALCLLLITLNQVGILSRFLPSKKNPNQDDSE